MHTFSSVCRLLLWDWTTLLFFELTYKFLLIFLTPYFQDILSYAMRRAGMSYLSQENIAMIFSDLPAVLIVLLLLLATAFYVYVEMAAIVLYCEAGLTGESVSVLSLLRGAVSRAFRIFQPRNLLMVPFVMLIIPLTGIPLTTGPVSTLAVPEFIVDFINEETVLRFLYGALVVGMEVLLLRWIFSINEMVLNRRSFRQACRVSINLQRGRKLRTVIYMIVWVAVFSLLASLAGGLVVGGLLLFTKYTSAGAAEAQHNFWFAFSRVRMLGQILTAVFGMTLNFGLITVLYYHCRGDNLQDIRIRKKSRRSKLRGLTRLAVLFVLLTLYSEMRYYVYYPADSLTTQVVAHRAGSLFAPENTVAALKEAKNGGADMAEIDVQQTKDGELVVLHDTNLKRVTGYDCNIWDITWEEIQALYRKDGVDLLSEDNRIPTLEQMIAEAKGRIRLMIELKSNGHGSGMEEAVLSLIDRYDAAAQCVIASMDDAILKKVKELNPDIKTAYITAVAYGDFEGLKEADMFSIEATFATRGLISRLHGIGKPVYVWTVNNEEQMRRTLEAGADGIVTDNPYLASYVLETQGRDVLIEVLADRFLGVPETEEGMDQTRSLPWEALDMSDFLERIFVLQPMFLKPLGTLT